MTLPRVPTRLGKGILSPHSPPRRRMRHLTLSLRGLLQGLRSIDALEWRFYRMQVNLHDSLCITAVFLYCYSHRKKRNLAQSPWKYAILTFMSKDFLCRGTAFSSNSSLCGEGAPPPVGRGTPPPRTLLPLAPSVPRLGSRLRRSTLPPSSTSGSAYGLLSIGTAKTDFKWGGN